MSKPAQWMSMDSAEPLGMLGLEEGIRLYQKLSSNEEDQWPQSLWVHPANEFRARELLHTGGGKVKAQIQIVIVSGFPERQWAVSGEHGVIYSDWEDS